MIIPTFLNLLQNLLRVAKTAACPVFDLTSGFAIDRQARLEFHRDMAMRSTRRLGIVTRDPDPGAAAIFKMTRNERVGLHGSVRRVRGHPMIFPSRQMPVPR